MTTEQTMAPILIINRSDSQCGNCGKSADPHAKTHDRILGYGPTNGTPGCGIEWTHVTTHYAGRHIAAATKAMRPDLIFIPTTQGETNAQPDPL